LLDHFARDAVRTQRWAAFGRRGRGRARPGSPVRQRESGQS